MAEVVVDPDVIRARVVSIGIALLTLAIQNVMEKPEVQAVILTALERNIESTILLAMEEVPPTEA